MKTLQDLVIEAIEALNSDEIMQLNNIYCENNNYSDDFLYHNDEDFLNENFNSVIDAVRAVSFGSYNFYHKYCQLNGQGNLDSYEELETTNMVDSADIIADYVIENEQLFSNLIDVEELREEASDEEED